MNEIFKNEPEIRNRLNEAKLVLPVANQAMRLFCDEGIDPTNEHLKGFTQGGAEFLVGCLGKIARAEIDKMDIKLDRLRQAFLRDATAIDEAKVTKIHAELYRLMGSSKVKPEYLEVTKSGEVRLTKSFVDSVETEFTVDLSEPGNAAMWQQIQAFCAAFNRLQVLAEERDELSLHECLDPRYAAFFTEKPGPYPKIEADPTYFLGFNGLGSQPVGSGPIKVTKTDTDDRTIKL